DFAHRAHHARRHWGGSTTHGVGTHPGHQSRGRSNRGRDKRPVDFLSSPVRNGGSSSSSFSSSIPVTSISRTRRTTSTGGFPRHVQQSLPVIRFRVILSTLLCPIALISIQLTRNCFPVRTTRSTLVCD